MARRFDPQGAHHTFRPTHLDGNRGLSPYFVSVVLDRQPHASLPESTGVHTSVRDSRTGLALKVKRWLRRNLTPSGRRLAKRLESYRSN
jgi:hypothetical protein